MDFFSHFAVGKSVAALAAAGALTFGSGNLLHKDRDVRPERPVRPAIEVVLSAAGGALVRGAEVTAVSDSTITAKTVWGDAALTWTVETDSDTEFVGKKNKDAEFSGIDVGETVSFRGTIDQDESAFTVDAGVVKNWSEE